MAVIFTRDVVYLCVVSVAERSRRPVTQKTRSRSTTTSSLFRYNAVEQRAPPLFSFVSRNSASLNTTCPPLSLSVAYLPLIIIYYCLTICSWNADCYMSCAAACRPNLCPATTQKCTEWYRLAIWLSKAIMFPNLTGRRLLLIHFFLLSFPPLLSALSLNHPFPVASSSLNSAERLSWSKS